MAQPLIQLTFAPNDPTLDDEERHAIALQLLRQLRQIEEVERVERVEDLHPEKDHKGLATLAGVLMAEVSWDNFKALLGFLGDRLGDKPISLKVKVGDREVEIEAKSRRELAEVERVANTLLAQMQKGMTDA